jgi:hypothetical protein
MFKGLGLNESKPALHFEDRNPFMRITYPEVESGSVMPCIFSYRIAVVRGRAFAWEIGGVCDKIARRSLLLQQGSQGGACSRKPGKPQLLSALDHAENV